MHKCKYVLDKESSKADPVYRIKDRHGNFIGDIKKGVVRIFSKPAKELCALLDIPKECGVIKTNEK